jgi:threonyl-tRNA synthetase
VRGFTQDDSHIFCTPEQLPAEIAGVLDLVRTLLTTFGFEFTAYLATRPKEKSIGTQEVWERSIAALREGAERTGIALELDEGGGAFYGPKIDFKMKDALGREWQTSTVQCDFNLPERFDLTFTDRDGARKRPIMVHRAIYGSLERFTGVLIEHYGGKFPFWLAPTQVALIPIREQHAEYCRELAAQLTADGLRVQCMDDAGHMNKKIKEATHEKVPFLLIAGDREVGERTVTVRQRDQERQETVPFARLRERVGRLQASRALALSEAARG